MLTNENVNVEAMYRAQVLLFGQDATMAIAKMADVIDQAMRDGYALGTLDAEANVEERLDAAFDEGFDQGVEFAELDVINEMAGQHYETLRSSFDYDLVRDSGDETTQVIACRREGGKCGCSGLGPCEASMPKSWDFPFDEQVQDEA